MMMPSISSPSTYPSVASSSSLIVRVEKATSEFLIGPDWTINIDICDTINSNQWLAKDVVKAVKKRLQHKNPKVQLLALTLLETMVKNCGDFVHFQIADRNILQEMVKIVKKKTDMHVRDKILVLLDSWQEAFGGSGGKYPQYYWAYEELRRSGLQFPQRSLDTAPIFTPPMSHPTPRNPLPGYGMPSNSSTRLDEAMAAEEASLSSSSINSMRNVLDLLADMLQAVNPSDSSAVKDEVIVDIVDRCRSNQKKLMQMLTTTGDEELLGQGLELNDDLQTVLAKHNAIASGLPQQIQVTNAGYQSCEIHDSSLKLADATTPVTTANGNPSPPAHPLSRSQVDEDEEEDEEDDFAQLARRHSKNHPSASQAVSPQSSVRGTSMASNSNITSLEASSSVVMSNALVPLVTPDPVRTTKEQDIIDLLSITLSTPISSTQNPQDPTSSVQNLYQGPSMQENNPYASQAYIGSHSQTFNTYVAPWAKPQPQPQPQVEPHSQPKEHAHDPVQQHPLHNAPYHHSKPQPHLNQEARSQPQSYQYSTAYPPPPWAATPGYSSNPNPLSRSPYAYSTTLSASTTTSIPSQGARTFQHVTSIPGRGSNVEARTSSIHGSVAHPVGQKPFIPSYRLFEDLNVLGNADGKLKMTSNSGPPLSGTNAHSMVGGGK